MKMTRNEKKNLIAATIAIALAFCALLYFQEPHSQIVVAECATDITADRSLEEQRNYCANFNLNQ